jgi:hypothetical protein
MLEYGSKDAIKTSDMLKLMAFEACNESMTEVFLLEEDKILTNMNGTRRTFIYPTIKCKDDNTEIELVRALNMPEFLYSLPDRIKERETVSVTSWSLWNNTSPDTYYKISTPERLCVEIKNSTIFYRKDSIKEADRKAGYMSYVYLEGVDENFNEIKEMVSIKDEGIYTTRNIFKSLTYVQYDGFESDIEVFLTSSREGLVDTSFIHSKFSVGSTKEGTFPLRYYLFEESFGSTLLPAINKSVEGREYLRPENEIQNEQIEVLCTHALLDSDSNHVNVVSIAINPVDTKIYALENTGRVLVYEPEFTFFNHRGDLPSSDTYMDIQPETNRVELNEEIDLWTWFRIPTVRVKDVSVKRVDPDGTEEYLQSDLTWGITEYLFLGEDATGKFPEESWKDFSFPVAFNKLGQWDFYCTVYLPALRNSHFTSKTSVMCEYLKPIAEYSAEVGEEIFFDKENLLCIKQSNTYKRFKLIKDIYIADPLSQRVILKESYDEIEIYHE